ncbi:MAG TPA: Gfo/Idh/MocA family oxidoreductase, partial [Flavitalea sp.]|nr:Gfo/Idh/MocA family oxidoreductase [Flavitalea sp.]
MPANESISRQLFLQQFAMAGVGFLLSSVNSLAFTNQQRRIKIAVIGCGSVSGQYLPHLSKSAYVELVSACDIIYERAKERAGTYKIPNHYPNIDQLLAGASFELLVNLTDMQEHGRLNRQALQAGKHVWSEKPMANTYKEGKTLLDLAKSKNLRIWGAPAVVNSPQFAFMSRAIQDGKLGKL